MHTFGERYYDPAMGRPRGHRAIAERFGIRNPLPIDAMPTCLDEIKYNQDSQTLRIGTGSIHPVTPEVWDYDVGGMRVVRHWLNYRTIDFVGASSALDQNRVERWTTTMTDEILALIAVLSGCVAASRTQDNVLDRICKSQTLLLSELT
ncbi:type ISP restriction/modification enzyme, partial [Micromonospora harpali]